MASRRRGPVRYAVVGLGHIAQAAVLPAFAHAARISRLAALVSDGERKRRVVGRRYGVRTFGYDEYEACLQDVDAVYIALPNSMHAEYTIRAARAGVHALCEKPMAVTVEDCDAMLDACRKHRVKLMIAYRLHFEEVNLAVIDLVRKGAYRPPEVLQLVVLDDRARAQHPDGEGTGRPSRRRSWRSVNSGPAKLSEIDESTGALLRFDGERVAAFVTSFNAADVAAYRIVGTKGQVHVNPAYEYAEGLAYELTVNGSRARKRIGKRDQFAPELLYFSDCIRRHRHAGTLGRRRPAGRPHRVRALRIGGDGEGRAGSAVPAGHATDRAAADSPSRDLRAAARQGEERLGVSKARRRRPTGS